MNKNKGIIHYRLAASIFKKWLDAGIIDQEEFIKIDALLASKYSLSSGSIYR